MQRSDSADLRYIINLIAGRPLASRGALWDLVTRITAQQGELLTYVPSELLVDHCNISCI